LPLNRRRTLRRCLAPALSRRLALDLRRTLRRRRLALDLSRPLWRRLPLRLLRLLRL
jgi:hypothetical protein